MIEIFKNERASKYNQFVENWIPNYFNFINSLPNILNETKDKNLLSIGCGTGNEIEQFAKNANDWKITGIDPSPEMISQASEKLKEFNNITLIEGVVNDLDRKNQFGAATLLLVLHFMKDYDTKLFLLESIADRLKKEAPLVIFDITGTTKKIKKNLQILKKLLPPNIMQEEIDKRLLRIETELHYVSEKRLKKILKEAGFEAPLRFFQTSIYMGWITYKR